MLLWIWWIQRQEDGNKKDPGFTKNFSINLRYFYKQRLKKNRTIKQKKMFEAFRAMPQRVGATTAAARAVPAVAARAAGPVVQRATVALKGGKRNSRNATRKSRGVFSKIASPFRGLLRTATNVGASALNTVVNVPLTAVKGAKNTVRNSVVRLSSGVNNVVGKATTGVNSSLSSAFKRKTRKNMRGGFNNYDQSSAWAVRARMQDTAAARPAAAPAARPPPPPPPKAPVSGSNNPVPYGVLRAQHINNPANKGLVMPTRR